MSPNNKPTISKEDDAQDLNYHRYAYQINFVDQDDQNLDADSNQQNLDNGYVLLNQDGYTLDYSDTDSYTDSDDSDDQVRVTSDFSQINNSNVNVVKLDEESVIDICKGECKDKSEGDCKDNCNDDCKDNCSDDCKNPRLKSYLNNNQLPSEELRTFEREWDKKEDNESNLNPIDLNKGRV